MVEDDYTGPRFDDDISADFMSELLQWLKDEKRLHKKYAYKIIIGVLAIFHGLPSLVDVSVPDVSSYQMKIV